MCENERLTLINSLCFTYDEWWQKESILFFFLLWRSRWGNFIFVRNMLLLPFQPNIPSYKIPCLIFYIWHQFWCSRLKSCIHALKWLSNIPVAMSLTNVVLFHKTFKRKLLLKMYLCALHSACTWTNTWKHQMFSLWFLVGRAKFSHAVRV